MQAEQQQRIERAILAPENEDLFGRLLRGFFTQTHPALNERLLGLIDAAGVKPLTFDAALELIQREFPQDVYVFLYVAATRWVCKDAIEAHEQLLSHKHEAGGADAQAEIQDAAQLEQRSLSLAALDDFLDEVTKATGALGALQVADVEAANAGLRRAAQSVQELTDQLGALAAEAGEPRPTWTTREEFIGIWKRLAELTEKRHLEWEHTRQFKADLAQRLETAEVHHRLPRRKAELCALARRAAAEIRDENTESAFIIGGGPTDVQQWLAWAWAHEGTALEAFQSTVQTVSPSLAELLGEVDWADLRWPSFDTSVDLPMSAEAAPTAEASTPKVKTAPLKAVSPAAASKPGLPAVHNPEESPNRPESPGAVESTTPAPGVLAKPVETADKLALPRVASSSPFGTERAPSITDRHHALGPAPDAMEVPARAQKSPTAGSGGEDSSLTPENPLAATVWRLAGEGRWGLASHLVALDSRGSLPSPWVFRAAALGPRVNYEVSPVSQLLAEAFGESSDFKFEQLPAESQRATRLLLAGAALRPALLAPLTGAATVLGRLHLREQMRLPHLDALVLAVADFSQRAEVLRPEMLQGSHSREEWERQLEGVRAEFREWLTKAPNYGFNYVLASRIWRSWTGAGGALRRLVEQTAQAVPQNVPQLRENWKPWIEESPGLVQQAIREINQRKTMEGTARNKLLANIGEAVELGQRILALLAQSPERRTDFRHERAQHLVGAFRTHLTGAQRELQELAAQSGSDSMEAAVSLCQAAVADAAHLLDGKLPLPGGSEPDPRRLIDGELLRDPTLWFAEKGIIPSPQPTGEEHLLALAASPPNWRDAWDRQVVAENHAATFGLLELFRWQPPTDLNVAELERNRERELEACRNRLEKAADDTRRLLGEFVSLGLCRKQDYDDWNGEVENVKQEATNAVQFAPLRARLARVRENVQRDRDREVAEVRQRLDVDASILPTDRERITTLLAAGDVHTATDYLERAAQGLPLPETGSLPSVFHAFFGANGWLPKAQAALRQASFAECWPFARDGGVWQGLDFQLLGPDQRTAATSHLKLWLNLERQREANEAQATQFASALGLQPRRVTARPMIRGTQVIQPFQVQAELLDERGVTIVPAFGSIAAGRYTLHLVWGEQDAAELINLCRRETGDTAAHIVVCFRLLTVRERRDLAEVARKTLFKAVVVDRALFAFVCAQPTARFTTLLRCALPFSCVEPYTIAAGAVPPEMFYGRRRELESLADPRGSCFVYGGRQLGKTALLRALERRFHNLDVGRAAVFVDLKTELFSRGRPIDDLWNVLVTRLKEAGVLGDKVGATAGQDALFRHIKDWLGSNPDRRILLLLDEADSFLEEDGKETEHHEPFPRCQRLKGLMDETNRRFKVVFAGLHNVQRTTRVSNHPLAHLGEAICIGPMLREEARAAQSLVEEPLAAAGYSFDSPDTVGRILALTSCYPSLIQVFCHHLLLDLRANHVTRFSDPRATPPCVINLQHVETAYSSRVRQAIHEKVNLTLGLDKRYELIAYLLAFYHANQSGGDGVELRDIRTEVTGHWPAGFSEMRTDDEFRSLLEEMVGLGILRSVSGTSRFALRNSNVMMLLGTEEEIMRRLESAQGWEPVLKYEADKFRRVIADRPKLEVSPLVSPLTARAESELKAPENRVAVLYGVPAAGLIEVPRAMESLFHKVDNARGVNDAASLSERIARIDRPPGAESLLLVPAEIAWDETWVAAASQRVGQFTSKDAFLTVLFVADPARAAAVADGLDGSAESGIRLITLRPWHDAAVRQWVQDFNLGDDRAMRERIRQVTGNWPLLLLRLNPSSKSELLRSCEELERTLQQPAELAGLHAAFGFADEPADSPLRIAAELKQFTVDDVCDLSGANDEAARRLVGQRIAWAERLGLVSVSGGGLEFDSIAALALPPQV